MRADLVALDRLADSRLLEGVRSAAIPTGAEPEEQSPARDRLQRRRHVGQDSRRAIGHVEHERPERDSSRDFGQCAQHGPRFRHAGAVVAVGIAQVIPGPEPIEAGVLGRKRSGAHVGPAGAHRDQEQVGLQASTPSARGVDRSRTSAPWGMAHHSPGRVNRQYTSRRLPRYQTRVETAGRQQ